MAIPLPKDLVLEQLVAAMWRTRRLMAKGYILKE
jgi:hypothetical protein